MRKLFFVCFLATFAVINLWADELVSVPVATLTHNGEARQFYGASALSDAHAAAVSGDVITLNSGIFNACDITKGITLRGACMATTTEMSQAGMKLTRIQNDMRIKVPSSDPNTLKIEDLNFSNSCYVDSVGHVVFTRTMFNSYCYATGKMSNFDAIQCYITYLQCNTTSEAVYNLTNSTFRYSSNAFPKHMNATNCTIGSFGVSNTNSSVAVFQNCIFTYKYTGSYVSYYQIPEGCVAINCVSPFSSTFSRCQASNCKSNVALSSLFNTTSTSIDGPTTMQLTETAAATYLGTDGTQVGIYGGLFPFTYMPDNPLVTRCDIANKTTEDGKLKVEIEVKSVQ